MKDLRTTQERKGLEEEPEAAKVAADAQAAAHQAALAQAAADGAASCAQAERQAASRKRAAVPGDDASEEQPSLVCYCLSIRSHLGRLPRSCVVRKSVPNCFYQRVLRLKRFPIWPQSQLQFRMHVI